MSRLSPYLGIRTVPSTLKGPAERRPLCLACSATASNRLRFSANTDWLKLWSMPFNPGNRSNSTSCTGLSRYCRSPRIETSAIKGRVSAGGPKGSLYEECRGQLSAANTRSEWAAAPLGTRRRAFNARYGMALGRQDARRNHREHRNLSRVLPDCRRYTLQSAQAPGSVRLNIRVGCNVPGWVAE